jgi:hypothetical protein
MLIGMHCFFFSHTHTHNCFNLHTHTHPSSSVTKMEFPVSKLEMTRQSFLIRSFYVIPLFLCFLTYSQQQQQQLLPIPVLVNDVETTFVQTRITSCNVDRDALFLFFTHTTHTHTIALIYIPTHILVGYKNGVSRFQT